MTTLPAGLLVLAGLAWLGLLFAAAVFGERSHRSFGRAWPVIYSLSLAVYCTAWTFYGTTAQAARSGWPIPPTFVGTLLIFVFGWPFLTRLVRLSKQHNSTSIADFIASRFGKSSTLAAVVTAVALLGTVPYISLQLKAVAMSFGALAGAAANGSHPPAWGDLALYVAIAMAVFAVLFGTRRSSAVEHNRGLVLAMAFESLFKLAAMLALAGFVLFALYSGPADWAARTAPIPISSTGTFLTLVLLGALAMFTLPHQFHIGVVECRDEAHLRTARWLFPLFLLLIGLPSLPLARAGEALLGAAGAPSDLYALLLPLSADRSALALFAFLGGVSAATGMVILASLTLSIMIGNHWLTPLLLNHRIAPGGALRIPVRLQRRAGIVLVLLLAWVWNRVAGTTESLAEIGALSFSGLAQLAPAMVLAVYCPGLAPRALLSGLFAGVAVWAYVLLLPLLLSGSAWIVDGPLGLSWLSPDGLLGLTRLDALTRAVLTSLAVNLALIGLVQRRLPRPHGSSERGAGLEPAILHELARRFLPGGRVAPLFATRCDPAELEAAVEHELAAVVGAASARLLLDAARRQAPAPLETVADLVGQASEQARFSREVLSGALEHMSQGICVVDDQMRLVAWNRAYLDLFDYPDELIRVGRPVADLLRHNLSRGLIDAGADGFDAAIERRLAHKRAGSPHRIERPWPDGRIIEIRGNPMPGGGFVATFTDVTAFRRAESELKRINETLEQRVSERTAELEAAKLAAERANSAKSRFLAAVSHDLVQPLNAAQLMTHSLAAAAADGPQREAFDRLSGALAATEDLLGSLLDISRLEAGGLEPRITRFGLAELFEQLAHEFGLMARERGLELRCRPTALAIESDPQMLRRILQNFLSNAVRYTEHGRILLGARRLGGEVLIGVWDTGPGIPPEARRLIFEEFRRLDPDRGAPGLGLGLAIAERMARLLGHPLMLQSTPGRGTLFGVRVPRAARPEPAAVPPPRLGDGAGGRVLVVDNDPQMLDSLFRLLGDWNYAPVAVATPEAALAAWRQASFELMLLDYHLDGGVTGLELFERLRAAGHSCPTLLISADHAAEVRAAARQAGCELLHKPLRPLALRSILRRIQQRAA